MEWMQTVSIILTVLGSAYYIHRDIHEDMRIQSARTEKLYEMFCDVQKQMKDEILSMKKEQYDFMKEGRK